MQDEYAGMPLVLYAHNQPDKERAELHFHSNKTSEEQDFTQGIAWFGCDSKHSGDSKRREEGYSNKKKSFKEEKVA